MTSNKYDSELESTARESIQWMAPDEEALELILDTMRDHGFFDNPEDEEFPW